MRLLLDLYNNFCELFQQRVDTKTDPSHRRLKRPARDDFFLRKNQFKTPERIGGFAVAVDLMIFRV